MSSKCDNNGCIGGRAFKTDESVRLDPVKEFCSYDCADEYVKQQDDQWVHEYHERVLALIEKCQKYTGSSKEEFLEHQKQLRLLARVIKPNSQDISQKLLYWNLTVQ